MSTLFDLSYISELTALMAAIFLLNKRDTRWQLFIFYMSFIIVIETIGWYIPFVLNKNDNDWLYNIYLFVETPFYIYVFAKATQFALKRKHLLMLAVFYLAFYFIDLIFIESTFQFNSNTQVLGNVILTFICCYFFFSVLSNDEALNLIEYEYFWLSNGLLFYSLGSIVVFLFLPSLRVYYQETCIRIYDYIINALNLLLYGSLIIAFVCRRKSTR